MKNLSPEEKERGGNGPADRLEHGELHLGQVIEAVIGDVIQRRQKW